MSSAFHLEVIEGPEQGRRLRIPPEGGRLGRSSRNDLCLLDPLLSRNHCHFMFRSGDGLWLTDLASANQTQVNGQPIDSCRIRPGDRILAGDTQLRVLSDEAVPAAVADAAAPGDASALPPVLDLGLPEEGRDAAAPGPPFHVPRVVVVAGLAVVLLLLALALAWLVFRVAPEDELRPPADTDAASQPVRIVYEKVEADAGNIFRYALQLTEDHQLSVQIDDLAENRHVRKTQAVDPDRVRSLVEQMVAAGWYRLDPPYEGIRSGDALTTWDLEIIQGRRVQRVAVRNRLEPDIFRRIRETLETFGKNELGIWAIQFSRERLLEMAYDALLLARGRLDAREVEYGNLARAIQGYREAEFYLETVDPKPEYYADILSDMREAREILNQRYEHHRLQADRAINLSDWHAAARELRILMELIPDRDDERHREVNRILLDVENRLRRTR